MAASYQVTKAECLCCPTKSSKQLHFFECGHTLCSKCLKTFDGSNKEKPRCPLCKHDNISMKDVNVGAWSRYLTTWKHAKCHHTEDKNLRYGEHDYQHSRALDQCIREIQEVVSAVQANIDNLKDELKTSSRSCTALRLNFEHTKRKITSKADREVDRVREREQQLMKEAENVFKDRVRVHTADRGHKLTVIGHSKRQLDQVVTTFMTAAKRSEILDHRETILLDLKELQEKSRPKESPNSNTLSFMDFEEVAESLGRLVLDNRSEQDKAPALNPRAAFPLMKWKLKTSIETYKHMEERSFNFAFDVAAISDDELVIADIVNSHLVACSLLPLQSAPVTRKSLGIPEKKSVNGIVDPCRVAVNMNSELIVVDSDLVKVHDRKYCPLHKITPGKGTPLCLAVTDFNLIALGYKNEICLFTPNGSEIRTFPAPMIGQYLSSYKKSLIYTNPRERKLESFNLKGDRVFSVDIAGIGLPRGVCCDKDGTIFVAFGIGNNSGKIVQYSLEGKFIGCIIEECGDPWSIKFTPSGDLVIAAGKSVKIYHSALSRGYHQ